MKEHLDAKESKCWNCRFGLCLSEKAQETIVHEGMRPIDDDFSEDMGFGEMQDPDIESGVNAHVIESTRNGAICYWAAYEIGSQQPPIRVEFVSECSRFEAKDIDPGPQPG